MRELPCPLEYEFTVISGFMKHLPNLLKQESTSAATLVSVLVRLYKDPRVEGQRSKEQVTDRLTS